MTRVLLFPGDIICDALGLAPIGDDRMLLRSFFNSIIWGAATTGVLLTILL